MQEPTERHAAALATTSRVVASYPSYGEAERAVDHLADRDFPVERVRVVAEGLTLVERVTGRATYMRAARDGAVSGALVGALVGFLFGFLSWVEPVAATIALAFYGLLLGAVAGALLGVLAHAVSGGRRSFESVGAIRARRYDVVVDEESADDAARRLDELGEAARTRP